MGFVAPFLLCIAVIILIQYHWRRRHLYKLASQLSGPLALPIIGNGLSFLCKEEDILKAINKISEKYTTPIRFWFGPILVIYFSCPEHIEKILSSSKLAYKHEAYDLVKIYLGDGLVSNSGEKYKKHRRLIQPLINLKFASGNIKNMQKHINIYIEKLKGFCGKGEIDVHDFTHRCFADIIGEIMLGTQMGAQIGRNLEFVHASDEMYKVGHARIMRPWLHPEIIYNLTSGKIRQNHITSVTTTFIKDKLQKAFQRVKQVAKQQQKLEPNNTTSIIDQIAEIIETDQSLMNNTDFLYHMYTLYCASEDTMTVITSVLFVCFGMYPTYQKLAAEEIRSVFGDKPTEINHEDLSKLHYLDMCIRDVLRLIPIAPIILRRTIEDFSIDNVVIPKGCGVLVSIFDVHRDPKHWHNPNHFHPDHFLPENVQSRHPFAFVPFSAGPRSCVGKVLAFIGLKLIMVNILQNFEIEADGKFPDMLLKCDITVRSLNGYKVRLKPRVWSN